MKTKGKHAGLASFAAGLAFGAGLILLRNYRARQDPQHLPDQKRISLALDRALARARRQANIPLAPRHRYVIFSDHHKGAGDPADDFRHCKETYLHALQDYHQRGFTLILLGDAEELLENPLPEVLETYPDVFAQEQRFYPDRYMRVIGNHDAAWGVFGNVRRYLDPFFPGIRIYRSLVLQYHPDPLHQGEIFLAHGHQGTLDSDVFGFLPPLALPFYRQFQNLTKLGQTSPSKDECLRGTHDTMMYRWASGQPHLLLIAGHTHRPVWSSRTHLDKLLWEYTSLLQLKPEERPVDYADRLAQLQQEIEQREEKFPPCNDTLKTRPCYFNTGCCRFKDGDITGIELEDGELRLVKWGRRAGEIQRNELEAAPLSDFFAIL